MRSALIVACATALALPAAAQAGSASVSQGTLIFAGGAERNSVKVSWDHGWLVEDTAGIDAGPGCTQDGSRRVRCESGVERISVSAGDGDDTVTNWSFTPASLSGGVGNDTLYGGAAADSLDGGSGQDMLYGSFGGDSLDGGLGADRLSGGSGLDTAEYGWRSSPVRVDPDNRDDDGEAGEGDDVRRDVENAVLGAGDDIFAGSQEANHVLGGAGSDSLEGGEGDDTLEGGDGVDAHSGGAGADTIRSRDGVAEDVGCGAGADTAYIDAGDRASDCELMDVVAEPPAGGAPGAAPSGGEPDGSELLQGLQLVERAAPVPLSPRGRVTLRTQCLADTVGGCRGTITLELAGAAPGRAAPSRRSRRRRVGRRSFRVQPGHEADVSVRISRRGRRLIKRRRRARLRARIDTITASGPVTTRTSVRVKASRRGGGRRAKPERKQRPKKRRRRRNR